MNEDKMNENISKQAITSEPVVSLSDKVSFFEKISFWIIIAVTFILPIFTYTPFEGFSLDFSKKAILIGGAIVALIFWLLARFEDGKFVLPGGVILKSGALLLISYIVSSLLLLKGDNSVSQSIFGLGFENDTLVAIIFLVVLMFLSAIYFQSTKRLSYFYTALLSSILIVFITEVIQIYTGGTLLSNNGIVTNLVGKWNDLGIFFGLGAVLSLSAIELLELVSYPKIIIWLTLLASLFGVAFVNYSPVWVTIGISALLILIYSVFYHGNFKDAFGYSKRKILARPTFIVILLCAGMFFSQVKIGEFLSKYNIVNIDVRPSLSATVDITQNVMKESWKNILFGSGPNSFSSQWVKYKPDGVNETIFWNIDFNAGVGRVPSYLVTLGLFGFLSWVFFLGALLYLGFKTVLFSGIQKSLKFLVFTSFMGTIYLWAFSVTYVPDIVLLGLTFITTGVFISSLIKSGTVNSIEFSFLDDPRLGFVSVLALVLLVITTISGGYLIGKKFMGNYLFQKGMSILNIQGNLDGSFSTIKNATEYDEQDTYFRTLSEISILKLKDFVANQKVADKESLAKLQGYMVDASGNAQKSIALNKTNYLNWMELGRVGEAVVPLKVVDGAYSLASDSYMKALSFNPNNPMIYLNMARLEIANNDMKKAKEFLNQSLSQKNNFTSALYLLSQIEASQGNLKEAINRAEQAYLFAPDDLGILFQLGFLKYSNKDFDGAVASLERAVAINPQYSNAKYFLGLSYASLGQNSKALAQFKEIGALNPDNEEVKSIIKNLTQGKEPFSAPTPAKKESTKKVNTLRETE